MQAAALVREQPRVTMSIRNGEAGEVIIEVSENGPGVEPSVRDRLFEPYVTTKKEGTGLGLAIVQTILHEHGGEVRSRDNDDNGASFEVVLPIDGPPLLQIAPAITVDPET